MFGAQRLQSENVFCQQMFESSVAKLENVEHQVPTVETPRIRFINKKDSDLGAFVKHEDFHKFLKEFETDLSAFKRYLSQMRLVNSDEFVKKFESFYSKALEVKNGNNPNYIPVYTKSLYGEFKEGINELTKLLNNVRISEKLKEKAIIHIMDGIELCIPGLVDRIESGVFNLKVSRLGIVGELKIIKTEIISGLILSFYHDVYQADRLLNPVGNEVHDHASLVNLVAEKYDLEVQLVDVHLMKFNSEEGKQELTSKLTRYIDQYFDVKEVMERFIQSEMQKLSEIFSREGIDIKHNKVIPVAKLTPSLNQAIQQEFIDVCNAKSRCSNIESELKIFDLVKFTEDCKYFDLTRLMEYFFRWIYRVVLGVSQPDIIYKTDKFKLLTYSNSCYWVDKKGKDCSLTLKLLTEMRFNEFSDKVWKSLVLSALLNENSDSDFFMFFTGEKFIELIKTSDEFTKGKIFSALDGIYGSLVYDDIVKCLAKKVFRGSLGKDDFLLLSDVKIFNDTMRKVVSEYSGFDIVNYLGEDFELASLPVTILKHISENQKQLKALCVKSVNCILEKPETLLGNLKELVIEGVDISKAKDVGGNNFLMLAIKHGNFDLFNFLFKSGLINLYDKNKHGDTLLMVAIKCFSYDVAMYILQSCDCRKMIKFDMFGNSSIFYLICSQKLLPIQKELLTRILEADCVDLNKLSKSGNHKEHLVTTCVRYANVEALSILLKSRKLKLIPSLFISHCVFHRFATEEQKTNQANCMKLLLQNTGIQKHLLKVAGGLYLIDSLKAGNSKLFNILLESGLFDLAAKDKVGDTIWHHVVRRKKIDFLNLLLEQGNLPSFEQANTRGETIMSIMSGNGYQDIAAKVTEYLTRNKVRTLAI